MRDDRPSIRRRIGAAIERRRREVGLGVEQLAKAARIDTSQMAKTLRGEVGLSLYSLPRVARVLDCTPAEILDAAFPASRSTRRRPSGCTCSA